MSPRNRSPLRPQNPINRTFANLANRHGPVLSLWFGSRPVLLVSSPSAAEECLSKNDVVFCNRPSGFLAGKYLGYDYTSIMWAPYGPHWRNLRRISIVEILSSHRLQLLAGIRVDEVRLLIQRLRCSDAGEGLEMKPPLLNMTMNMMTRMIFGKRYYGVEGEEAKRFKEVIEGTFKLFNEICIGDMVPCLRWLDRGKVNRFKRFKEQRDSLMREVMEENRKIMDINNNNNNNNDNNNNNNNSQAAKPSSSEPLIQVLLKSQLSDPEYYKDDVVFGLLLDLLVAGSDSSAGVMEWALSLLLNNPNTLKKAQTEIDIQVGYERLLQESDLNHLPYLRAIINETLRMYPAAQNLVPHELSQDCTIEGYHIPRGTMLQVSLWAIQNDPKLCADPVEFRPERFDGLDGYRIGFKMMPFGAGRRSCPGEGLAVRVIGLTLGCLIQCFDWATVDDRAVDMTTAPGFNLHKAEPLKAKLKPRSNMIKLLSHM